MSKLAVTIVASSIAFDGINVIHFKKGDEFKDKQAERLVEIGFAEWKDGRQDDDLAVKLESAQKAYSAAEAKVSETKEAAEKAAEKAVSASTSKKQKAEKAAKEMAEKAAKAVEAFEIAEKALNKLLS